MSDVSTKSLSLTLPVTSRCSFFFASLSLSLSKKLDIDDEDEEIVIDVTQEAVRSFLREPLSLSRKKLNFVFEPKQKKVGGARS